MGVWLAMTARKLTPFRKTAGASPTAFWLAGGRKPALRSPTQCGFAFAAVQSLTGRPHTKDTMHTGSQPGRAGIAKSIPHPLAATNRPVRCRPSQSPCRSTARIPRPIGRREQVDYCPKQSGSPAARGRARLVPASLAPGLDLDLARDLDQTCGHPCSCYVPRRKAHLGPAFLANHAPGLGFGLESTCS